MKRIYAYSTIVWFLLIFAAIFNAAIRESFFSPNFGEHAGHVMSTITFICILFAVSYLLFRKVDMEYTQRNLVVVGILWLVLTILFEFGFGHFVMGNSWEKLLADYNLLQGRVWVLVPIATLFLPWLNGHYLKK